MIYKEFKIHFENNVDIICEVLSIPNKFYSNDNTSIEKIKPFLNDNIFWYSSVDHKYTGHSFHLSELMEKIKNFIINKSDFFSININNKNKIIFVECGINDEILNEEYHYNPDNYIIYDEYYLILKILSKIIKR